LNEDLPASQEQKFHGSSSNASSHPPVLSIQEDLLSSTSLTPPSPQSSDSGVSSTGDFNGFFLEETLFDMDVAELLRQLDGSICFA